jgi:hypothetical protein
LITQEVLSQHYGDDIKLSFPLFDEIGKASDELWQLILGILDKATLTPRRQSPDRSVEYDDFLEPRERQITEVMTGGMGFVQATDKPAGR